MSDDDERQPFDPFHAALMMECTAVELLRASASRLETVADLRGDAAQLLDAVRAWPGRRQGALVLAVPVLGDELSDEDAASVLRQMAEQLRRFAFVGRKNEDTLLEDLAGADPDEAANILDDLAKCLEELFGRSLDHTDVDYEAARVALQQAHGWLVRYGYLPENELNADQSDELLADVLRHAADRLRRVGRGGGQ